MILRTEGSVRVADDSLEGRIALFDGRLWTMRIGTAQSAPHNRHRTQIGTAHLDLRPIMLYAQL